MVVFDILSVLNLVKILILNLYYQTYLLNLYSHIPALFY